MSINFGNNNKKKKAFSLGLAAFLDLIYIYKINY